MEKKKEKLTKEKTNKSNKKDAINDNNKNRNNKLETTKNINNRVKIIFITALILFIGIFLGIIVANISNANINSYLKCIKNNGDQIYSYPAQCVFNNIVFIKDSKETIDITSCKIYFDGCNNCFVLNGDIKICSKNTTCTSENSKTPTCILEYDTGDSIGQISKNECIANGGDWVVDGNKQTCYQKTTDVGNKCTDSNDCESFCEVNSYNDTKGVCYETIPIKGCHLALTLGRVKEVCE